MVSEWISRVLFVPCSNLQHSLPVNIIIIIITTWRRGSSRAPRSRAAASATRAALSAAAACGGWRARPPSWWRRPAPPTAGAPGPRAAASPGPARCTSARRTGSPSGRGNALLASGRLKIWLQLSNLHQLLNNLLDLKTQYFESDSSRENCWQDQKMS